MKRVFGAELLRRQKVSGTFDMTEGTVKPFKKYETGDPVAEWYLKNRSMSMVGKAWDPECDCEYLRAAMKGLGLCYFIDIRSNIFFFCNTNSQWLKQDFIMPIQVT